jgi:hypothetical protein
MRSSWPILSSAGLYKRPACHLVHENGGTVRHARSVGRGARFVMTF